MLTTKQEVEYLKSVFNGRSETNPAMEADLKGRGYIDDTNPAQDNKLYVTGLGLAMLSLEGVDTRSYRPPGDVKRVKSVLSSTKHITGSTGITLRNPDP